MLSTSLNKAVSRRWLAHKSLQNNYMYLRILRQGIKRSTQFPDISKASIESICAKRLYKCQVWAKLKTDHMRAPHSSDLSPPDRFLS